MGTPTDTPKGHRSSARTPSRKEDQGQKQALRHPLIGHQPRHHASSVTLLHGGSIDFIKHRHISRIACFPHFTFLSSGLRIKTLSTDGERMVLGQPGYLRTGGARVLFLWSSLCENKHGRLCYGCGLCACGVVMFLGLCMCAIDCDDVHV